MIDPGSRWDAKRALAFMGETPLNIHIETPGNQSRVASPIREKWFRMFHREFPKEHRVLAHALMLFDSGDQTPENMCSAVAVSAMLFKTRTARILQYVMAKLKELKVGVLETISTFVQNVCEGSHRLSEWEQYEGSFEEYVNKRVGSHKKRKYFC